MDVSGVYWSYVGVVGCGDGTGGRIAGGYEVVW